MHADSHFYAQNITILPVYNKIFARERPKMRPQGFDGITCEIDPDLPIYRYEWIQHNAKAINEAFELDNLINMNGGNANVTYKDWISFDLFEREALKIAYNKYATEENKKQQKMQADIDQKIEAAKEYKSAFSGVTKPTFIN